MVRAPDLSRWRVHLLWLVVALAAAACTWWAATALLTPSGQDENTQASAPTYTAVMGEVGVAAAAQASFVFQQRPAGVAGINCRPWTFVHGRQLCGYPVSRLASSMEFLARFR